MDFIDLVKAFSATVPSKLSSIKTEEATKNFLIMPFIYQILGYDAFNPNEVMPEYDANVGASKKFKLDYAILKDNKPIILIECKCYGNDMCKDDEWSQLFAYFSATDARIGVLTNGVTYKFYSDLERPNRMDKNPFLEIDLLNLNELGIRELAKLSKSAFNVDIATKAASELKYVGGIKAILKQQVKQLDDEFVKYFFKRLCPENNFVGQLKEDFSGYTQRAMQEFIREEIENLLDIAAGSSKASEDPPAPIPDLVEPEISSNQSEFSEDEREGFYMMKSILRSVIDPARVTYKDTMSYCNILLDGNGWRQIVRFHFNNPQRKKLEIYTLDKGGNKASEMVSINDLNEIYQFADKFHAIVTAYEKI